MSSDQARPTSLGSRNRATIAALVGLNAIAALLEAFVLVLVAPLAQAIAVDNGSINRTIGPLFTEASPRTLLGLAVAAVVGFWTMRLIAVHVQARLVARVESEARQQMYDSLIGTSFEFRSSRDQGYLQGVQGWTTARASRIGHQVNAMAYALNLVVMIGGSFLVEPVAAVVIAVAGVALALAFRPLVRRSRRLATVTAEEGVNSAVHLAETESLGLELEIYGAGGWATQRWSERTHALVDARRRSSIITSIIRPTYQASALLVAFVALAFALFGGDVDVPALGAVALLLLRSLSYGQALQSTMQRLADSDSVEQLVQKALEEHEAHARPTGRRHLDGITRIDLESIDYSYPGADTVALDGVDLTIRRGEKIGIVGPSGAGKSTLAQLLLRLREPNSGIMRVNGRPAREYDAESWTRAIAFVPQSPALLQGSLRDNIAVFRPHVDDADVAAAVGQAGLDSVVSELPDGLDTEIGVAQRALSGGQLQRVGIARALAGRPQVIVLDEPTSALDADSEAIVTTTLAELPDEVTVLVIAHRLSTLRACARILVVEAGRISADGAPSEVLGSNAFYERAMTRGTFDLTASSEAPRSGTDPLLAGSVPGSGWRFSLESNRGRVPRSART